MSAPYKHRYNMRRLHRCHAGQPGYQKAMEIHEPLQTTTVDEGVADARYGGVPGQHGHWQVPGYGQLTQS